MLECRVNDGGNAKFIEHPGHQAAMIQDLTAIWLWHRWLLRRGDSTNTPKLLQTFRGGAESRLYEYDFGDRWDHELVIEKILPLEAGKHYPACLAGKRACPPEDCGGIWGYAGSLEAIHDPKHPEHEEMLEWVGGEFDPDAFDVDEVNTGLQRLK
jgi:hypothetical protein